MQEGWLTRSYVHTKPTTVPQSCKFDFIAWAFPTTWTPLKMCYLLYVRGHVIIAILLVLVIGMYFYIPPPPSRRSEVAVMAHSGIPAILYVKMAMVHFCLPTTYSQSRNQHQLLQCQPCPARSSCFHVRRPNQVATTMKTIKLLFLIETEGESQEWPNGHVLGRSMGWMITSLGLKR